MLRRNGSDTSIKTIKIPIRSARASKNDAIVAADRFLRQKYLQVSVGAFHYRNVQKYLEDKNRMKELQILADDNSHIKQHLELHQIKECIKGIILERVEKDYHFGMTFHGAFFGVLEKFQRIHRRLKQRNLYNRYYFSSCPPKISLITQPTATTFRPPQTNSTIQLQTLTKNLEAMLKPSSNHSRKNQVSASPDKKFNRDKSKKAIRSAHQVPEENYGLKNYRKAPKARLKGASKDKDTLFSVKYCITPQPHALKDKDYTCSPSPSQGRLSQRRTMASRSNQKKRH